MTTGCGSPAKQKHSEHFNRAVGQRRTRHTRLDSTSAVDLLPVEPTTWK